MCFIINFVKSVQKHWMDKMLCFKFISKHTFGVIINVLWSPVSDGNVEI